MSRDIFKKRTEYKPFEYPEVQQFIDAMNKTFWVHSEVNFDADVQDFKTKLKPHEQECIKRNSLAIAQVEVAVKPFWGDIYKTLPKPEFNNLGSTFAESENRHSEAYSRLIEVLGLNDEFKKLIETPVFKKKLELFEKHFGPDIDFVDKLLFFVIVIENSSLFSQFANILAMSRFKGAMKNIANIINWSAVDENCLDLRDTQILTPKGWRMIKDMQAGDEVFGFKEGKIRLERVLKTISKKLGDKKLYNFSSAFSGVTMTEDHDVIYKQSGVWKKSPLREINQSSTKMIPVTGLYESDNQIELTDWDRLRIAAQADGCLRKNKNKAGETYYIGQNNGKNLIFGLKRERKVSRLRDLLNRLGVEYSESKEDSRGYYHFKLNYDLATNPFPKNFDWVDLSKVNRKYAEEFIEEMSHWDGSIDKNAIIYSTKSLSDAEKVQAMGILAGYVTNLTPNQKKGYDPTYRVNLTSKDTGEVILRSHTKKLIEDASPDLEVGCVTVPSGGIIVKRGYGRPMITGNCHANAGIFLLNQIFLEHPEMKKSQEAVEEIIKDYIAYESELLDWIFEEGEFEWYTKEDVVNFMKFRVDTALEQMGYNKIYNITAEQYSKMKWFDEEVFSGESDDFFAKRPTAYTKHDKPFDAGDLF
jgi:ribonucleoside-diphosphate reductase